LFLLEEAMNSFKGSRVVHEYVQTNPAPPEKLFPLLCPVREAEWLPGWQYRLVYSESGFAELGCVFTSLGLKDGQKEEKTWIVTEYDRGAGRIAFAWIAPELVIAQLQIHVVPSGDGSSQTRIRYCYTGLSKEGNRELESYDWPWFEARMKNWETTINHYLRTGERVSS
jgi:hypothetical protein